MKSLKRGLCAALAVMLSLSFAACGDRKPEYYRRSGNFG